MSLWLHSLVPTYLIKQPDEQMFCSVSPQTQIESRDPSSIQCQLPSDYRWMAQALPILKAASHPKSLFCISTVGPPQWLSGEESACNAGDMGSIPGSGRPPGEGNGNALQYSCLENPMDRRVWQATVHGVAKSQRRWKQLNNNNKLFSSRPQGFSMGETVE